MEKEKDQKTLEDKGLEDIAGGAGQTNGWVCTNCGNPVTSGRFKNGKPYCHSCYNDLFVNT